MNHALLIREHIAGDAERQGALSSEENIGRLQVTVNEVRIMQEPDTTRNLQKYVDGLDRREVDTLGTAGFEDVRQTATATKLHAKEACAVPGE